MIEGIHFDGYGNFTVRVVGNSVGTAANVSDDIVIKNNRMKRQEDGELHCDALHRRLLQLDRWGDPRREQPGPRTRHLLQFHHDRSGTGRRLLSQQRELDRHRRLTTAP